MDIVTQYVPVNYRTEIRHASSERINITVSNVLVSNSVMD